MCRAKRLKTKQTKQKNPPNEQNLLLWRPWHDGKRCVPGDVSENVKLPVNAA